MEEKGNAYGVFAENFERQRETDLRIQRIKTRAIQDEAKRTHLGKMVMNIMSLKYGYLLDELNKCWLLKRDFRCVEMDTAYLPSNKKRFSPCSHVVCVAVQEN
jgi:hypothetical protein